jgi:hypothetical protein
MLLRQICDEIDLPSSRGSAANSILRSKFMRGWVSKGIHVKEACPTVNSIRLALRRESVDALCHGRHAETDLVRSRWVVSIKSFA